jgi:hypothetical protein
MLTATKPEPFLLQSTIDMAKVIGLPRLKTMDKFFAKAFCINEVEQEFIYITYSRMDFIKRYMRLNSFNS